MEGREDGSGSGDAGSTSESGRGERERGDQLQSRARCREGLFAPVGVRPSGRWLEVEKPRVPELHLSDPTGKG